MKFETKLPPTGLLVVPFLALAMLPGAGLAKAEDAPAAEFVSDRTDLILVHTQTWGEFGVNTAAHLSDQPAPPLQIGDKRYANGLGTHALGEIVLALEGQYARFEAEVGVQPQPGNPGSVVFEVLADGKAVFTSDKMSGRSLAQPVSVSVEGIEELRLVVTDAGDGVTCDLANWADARLVPAPNAAKRWSPGTSVDMAPFARVATWDPARMDGARAKRTEEFRAEDLFTETEVKPNQDGTFTVAAWTNGVGCIGLQWLNRRAIRELTLEFVDQSQMPKMDAVHVEGWFGESAWQGNWQALTNEFRREGPRLICKLAPRAGVVQTRKVRWIFPAAPKPPSVRLSASTRSSWATTNLVVQVEKPKLGSRGEVRVWNGAPVNQPGIEKSKSEISWRLSEPLRLSVRFSRPSPLKSDPTVLQFRLPTGDVAVGVEDVLANDCVFLPDHGLFVAREPLPVTLADYKRRISDQNTILDEVRAMPDQTFAQAMAKTHHDAQREGPVLLSLACDNSKFIVERDGKVQFHPEPYNWLDTRKRIKWRNWYDGASEMQPQFGEGKNENLTRRLDGRWLPIPVISVEKSGIRYTQRSFVSPYDAAGSTSARWDRKSVCVVQFTVSNTQSAPAVARLMLSFLANAKEKQPAELLPSSRGALVSAQGRPLALVDSAATSDAKLSFSGGSLTWEQPLAVGESSWMVVYLPGNDVKPEEVPSLGGAQELRGETEKYWKAMLHGVTEVRTPDEFLNDLIRSSQVRCLIAGRSEADGARIGAYIGAVAYGPLESESHSIIRGMDFLGHDEFARKSLDFFIHRYNTNGFLTTGYTTFGTAWHLWTLGEHYQLSRNTNWLRRVAPEVARVCHWIVRQTEKTKKLDAYGRPVPEYGLMPPGVLADWNAFAYHFTMNAYYVAALREVGRALKDIGHPDAQFFITQSDELRKNTLRAYAWTQSRAPALALRDGTWITHYPSQVHSPGNLADFFPGEDAGRSWCYNVELGAHQLVPAGVLAPRSREVTGMMDHMEDVQFLSDGWFDYPATLNHADWFNNGGFSKVQPYYCRNGEIYAMQDEVKPFVRSYFNSIASLLNPEVMTFWEHFRHSGAWDKTHETGYFLQQTRFMLAMEHGNELWLAPLITSNWLKHGLTVNAASVPTRFGKVSFRLASHVRDGFIEAQVEPPTRSTPKAVVLRLRHPEGKPMRSVTVNGKPHPDFDAKRETITLPRGSKPLEVRTNY